MFPRCWISIRGLEGICRIFINALNKNFINILCSDSGRHVMKCGLQALSTEKLKAAVE